MFPCSVERVFLCATWSVIQLETVGENFVVMFQVLSVGCIHNIINKVKSTDSLLDPKKAAKSAVCLKKKKAGPSRGTLEYTPQNSLRRFAQGTGISKSSAAFTSKLLKLRPHKATVVHALQLRYATSRINFCSWFLQSLHDGEVNPCFLLI
jgi:hypothetical protein